MSEERQQFTQEQKMAVLESAEKLGVKEAAAVAGVHYTTVYEWRRKLEAVGREAFLAYRPASRGRGIKRITQEQEQAILDTWGRDRGLGPGQVRGQLRRQGITISTRTVRRVMEANGYHSPGKEGKKQACQRFEATRPLELVQVDILERYIHKAKVYLLVLVDDYSRFVLGWRLLEETSIDAVIGLVEEATERYGKMEEILSDRGFVFYSWRGINRFERYLEQAGIEHTHARPHHPQTLGKVEAWNRRIGTELFRQVRFGSVREAEEAIGEWVEGYNHRRTHQGLGGFLVPADRFHGRVAEVEQAIAQRVDPEGQLEDGREGIARSVLNVMWEPRGAMSLWVMGQRVATWGGRDGGEIDGGGGGDADSGAQDREGEGTAAGDRCEGDL
jgi:transposase InsO family protein